MKLKMSKKKAIALFGISLLIFVLLCIALNYTDNETAKDYFDIYLGYLFLAIYFALSFDDTKYIHTVTKVKYRAVEGNKKWRYVVAVILGVAGFMFLVIGCIQLQFDVSWGLSDKALTTIKLMPYIFGIFVLFNDFRNKVNGTEIQDNN